jgi:transcriptional regulator GlxA family with amidase domain
VDRPTGSRRRIGVCGEETHRPTTVTEVATALGFDHLGRFSGRYKAMFGESSSTTLKT